MPTPCQTGTCPVTEAEALFAEIYPTTAEGETPAKTTEELDQEAAIASLKTLPAPPLAAGSLSAKCREYCKEIEKAEAERCRQLRERAAATLKRAGCPPKVIPYGKGKGSSTRYAAAASTPTSRSGGCSTGLCGR